MQKCDQTAVDCPDNGGGDSGAQRGDNGSTRIYALPLAVVIAAAVATFIKLY